MMRHAFGEEGLCAQGIKKSLINQATLYLLWSLLNVMGRGQTRGKLELPLFNSSAAARVCAMFATSQPLSESSAVILSLDSSTNLCQPPVKPTSNKYVLGCRKTCTTNVESPNPIVLVPFPLSRSLLPYYSALCTRSMVWFTSLFKRHHLLSCSFHKVSPPIKPLLQPLFGSSPPQLCHIAPSHRPPRQLKYHPLAEKSHGRRHHTTASPHTRASHHTTASHRVPLIIVIGPPIIILAPPWLLQWKHMTSPLRPAPLLVQAAIVASLAGGSYSAPLRL